MNKNNIRLKLSLVGVLAYLLVGYQFYINQEKGVQAYKIIVPSFISPYKENNNIRKYISLAKRLLNPDVKYIGVFAFSKSRPTLIKVYDPKFNTLTQHFDQFKRFLPHFYYFMTFNKDRVNIWSTSSTSYLFMDEKLIFTRTTGCFSRNITLQSNIPFNKIIYRMGTIPNHLLEDSQQREITRFKDYMLGGGRDNVQSKIDFVNKQLGKPLSTKRRSSYELMYNKLIVTLKELNGLSNDIPLS